MKKRRINNTDEGIMTSTGVVINGDISLSTMFTVNKDRLAIIKTFIAILASICTMLVLCSFLECKPTGIITCAVICISFAAFISSNMIAKTVGLVSLLAHFFYIAYSFKHIIDGLYVALDKYITRAEIDSDFAAKAVEEINKNVIDDRFSTFMIFCAIIIAALVSLGCIIRLNFSILFLATFPFLEIGLYHGWDPPIFPILTVIICWIMVIAITLVNHTTNKAGVNNTFAVHRKKQAFYFTSKNLKKKFFSVYIVSIALLCGSIFLIAVLFSKISGFTRPDSFKDLRRQITEAVDEFSLSYLKSMFADYDGGFGFGPRDVGAATNGRLGDKDRLDFSDEIAMNVKVEKIPKNSIYLRGYIAGHYEDNCWDPIDNKPDKQTMNLFDNLGIPIQNFSHLMFSYSTVYTDEVKNQISVRLNKASTKYIYAPYFTDYNSEPIGNDYTNRRARPYKDSYVKLDAADVDGFPYQFREFIDLTAIPKNYPNDTISCIRYLSNVLSSLKLEPINEYYSEFVFNNYLDVHSSSQLDRAYNDILSTLPAEWYTETEKTADIASAVKKYFNDQGFKYDLHPGKTESGKDFIDDFMDKKKGYCAYFASAGTLLMRKFGIPARYCEGYVIDPLQFKTNNGQNEANPTDRDAHAWCEVFINGYGWLPVEFTPGYDNTNPNRPELPKPASQTQTVTTPTSAATTQPPATTTAPETTFSAVTSDKGSSAQTSKPAGVPTSVDVSGGNGGGIDSSDSGTSKPLSTAAKIAIVNGLLILFAVIVLLINRSIRLKKQRKQICDKDNRKAIKYCYMYYLKYLSVINISDESNITDEQQALNLAKTCKKLKLKGIVSDIKKMSALAIEAEHSTNEISDQDISYARTTLNKLKNDIVRPKLSLFGKISTKWIYGLY